MEFTREQAKILLPFLILGVMLVGVVWGVVANRTQTNTVFVIDYINGTIQVESPIGLFDILNTGQGNNDLYPMNQAVRTIDAVTFENVTVSGNMTLGGVTRDTWPAGGGLPYDQSLNTTDAVSFVNVTVTGNMTLGGVMRDTWPIGGTGGGGLVAPTFIIFVNGTGYYSINGTDGSVYVAGPIWDVVMNNTAAMCGILGGGKIALKEGNYSVMMNLPILLYSETEIELQGGALIWLHANKTDGKVLFKATGQENIVIHGAGIIDGNKDNQLLGYQTAVFWDGCLNCRVDTYIQHMRGWNVRDEMGGNDANNVYINRFYPDAGKKITPAKELMNQRAASVQVCNFSSTFTAAAVNEIYGDFSYITGNAMNGPEALFCVPNLGESATEPVRVQILYPAGQVWNDTNVGVWLYFTGTLDSTFDLTLEIWDRTDSQALQCNLPNIGDELNDEGINRWIQLMFCIKANTTDSIPRINMSDIDDIRLRFMSAVDTWNVTIDDMRLFDNYQLERNLVFCTDGPYEHQFTWLVPIADQYGYKICFATSYDIVGEDPGNGDVYLENLTRVKKLGHIIGTYIRAFDDQATPEPLSDAEILDFALLTKQWLIDHKLAEDFFFAHMNRHLLDTHTEDLLDDYFHVIKGSHPDGLSMWAYPFLSPNIVTGTPAAVLTRIYAAQSKDLVVGVFNHYNAEPDTISDIKTLFAYCAANGFGSKTWRDVWYDQCIVGSR